MKVEEISMHLNIERAKNGSKPDSPFAKYAGVSLKQPPQTQTSLKLPPAVTKDPNDRVNILLVDDTPENLLALEAVLSDLGQNIITANCGEEALRLLLRHDFAAILLDVNMPGINGFETAALIRQRKNSEHTPIIFLSAVSTSEMHMYKGYAHGAVDYISTPVIPEILRSKVAVFVELLKKTEEIKRQGERIRQIEEQEYRRKINEAAERLELETKRNRFFNLSIDMLGIASFDGQFRQLNPTWKTVLGFTQDELQGRPFWDFVHPEDRQGTLEKLDLIKASETPAWFENRYFCQDGSYRWLSWTVAPFLAEELFYVFARDITEQKVAQSKIRDLNEDLERRALELSQANAELKNEILVRQRAEQALKDTNSELESFSYSVSHDLRAPLRAMQSFAEALMDECSPQLGQMGLDFAQRIVAAGRRMEALIQDLLVYSRISHMELQLQEVPMKQVVTEALAQLEAPIKDSQSVICVDGELFDVHGHHSTLVQVVSNLISNSIKFVAPKARPEVRLWMEQRDGFMRLSVQDNGIGIAPEFHARIFRVFERLHGIESYPGTGIGLAIVRKGVERMGGTVGLESVVGHGSRFWIDLPRAIPETPAVA